MSETTAWYQDLLWRLGDADNTVEDRLMYASDLLVLYCSTALRVSSSALETECAQQHSVKYITSLFRCEPGEVYSSSHDSSRSAPAGTAPRADGNSRLKDVKRMSAFLGQIGKEALEEIPCISDPSNAADAASDSDSDSERDCLVYRTGLIAFFELVASQGHSATQVLQDTDDTQESPKRGDGCNSPQSLLTRFLCASLSETSPGVFLVMSLLLSVASTPYMAIVMLLFPTAAIREWLRFAPTSFFILNETSRMPYATAEEDAASSEQKQKQKQKEKQRASKNETESICTSDVVSSNDDDHDDNSDGDNNNNNSNSDDDDDADDQLHVEANREKESKAPSAIVSKWLRSNSVLADMQEVCCALTPWICRGQEDAMQVAIDVKYYSAATELQRRWLRNVGILRRLSRQFSLDVIILENLRLKKERNDGNKENNTNDEQEKSNSPAGKTAENKDENSDKPRRSKRPRTQT